MTLNRISVANVFGKVSCPGCSATQIAFVNKKSLKAGKEEYKAIGGVSELTPLGMENLRTRFSAIDFEKGMDARFKVEEAFVEPVIEFFMRRDPAMFEIDLLRELEEELVGTELPGQKVGLLTLEELQQVSLEYVYSIHQKPGSEQHRTVSDTAGIPTHRIFFVSNAIMPRAVYEKLAGSKWCRVISADDINRGFTQDGKKLGGNLFP